MHPKNIYATRTALTEWAGQSYVNKVDGVSLDPRIESFGSSTRLAIEVQRFGSYLTTIYAYSTTAIRNSDTGRDINVGSIVYGETNGPLAFWAGSAWTVEAFTVATALRAELNKIQTALTDFAEAQEDAPLLRDLALRQLVREQRGAVASICDGLTVARQYKPAMARPVTDTEVVELQYRVTGRTLSIDYGRTAIKSAGRAIYVGGDIDIPAPTTGHMDNEAITLVYAYPAYTLASAGRLSHPNIRNVVVSGGAAYNMSADQGVLVRPTAGADVPVTVNYDWSAARYDVIEADMSGALYRIAGTERERDVAEYVPSPTPGRMPLLIVRTTAWEVKVWPWVDEERQSFAAPALIQRARSRGMANLTKRLRSGNAVTIAGYGTSRTNLGGSAANPYAPNGPQRDTMATSGFMSTQGADFKAAIPLYDHSDGAGQIHTHIGWNWELLRAIQARYPGVHQYLNFGIGGTTSGNTDNGGTVAARLAGLTGSGAHTAVIELGMNELGTAGVDTAANLITIGQACLAANIDPVYIAPARPNAIYPSGLDGWITECQQNKAAADYLGAPYIDPMTIYGVDRPVALDPRDTCSSNLYNHDSVYELTAIGRLLTRIVLDI